MSARTIPGFKAWTWNITAWTARNGLYYALEQSGSMLGVPDEAVGPTGHFRAAPHHASLYSRPLHPEVCFLGRGCPMGSYYPPRHPRPIEDPLLDVFTQDEVMAYGKVVDAAKCPDDLESIAEITTDPL